jgi:predicted transcriptional regulator
MSITIELSPEVESRLEQEARRNGVDKTKYAGRLIEEHLPAPAGSENGKSPQLTESRRD